MDSVKVKSTPRKDRFYLVESRVPVVKRNFVAIQHLPRHRDVQNKRNVIRQNFKFPNQFIIGEHNYRLKQTIPGGSPSGADKILMKCGPVEIQWFQFYLLSGRIVRVEGVEFSNRWVADRSHLPEYYEKSSKKTQVVDSTSEFKSIAFAILNSGFGVELWFRIKFLCTPSFQKQRSFMHFTSVLIKF